MTDSYHIFKTPDKKNVLIVTSHIAAIEQTTNNTVTIHTLGGGQFTISSDFDWFKQLYERLYPSK